MRRLLGQVLPEGNSPCYCDSTYHPQGHPSLRVAVSPDETPEERSERLVIRSQPWGR